MEEEMRKRWKSNQEEKWKGQEPEEQNEREQVEGCFANINKHLNKKASWLSSLQYCN